MWGRMSTVCGMRDSAGPGDDEQRKWVSMDEWRERRRGEKNGQRREEAERRKEGTGRCPFGLLQVACRQLGPRREMCLCVTPRRGENDAGVKDWRLNKGGGLRGHQRSETDSAVTTTEDVEDNTSTPLKEN